MGAKEIYTIASLLQIESMPLQSGVRRRSRVEKLKDGQMMKVFRIEALNLLDIIAPSIAKSLISDWNLSEIGRRTWALVEWSSSSDDGQSTIRETRRSLQAEIQLV